MSYRTILVHVDKSANAPARIKLAARLAQMEEAHLVGAAMTGMPRYMYAGSPFDVSGALVADYLRYASKRSEEALAKFEEVAASADIRSRESRRTEEDEYSGLCLQARYADLLVLGQTNPDDHGEAGLLLDLPEYVILNSGRPVLMVPYAGEFTDIGKRCLVAWNGSTQAARAVTTAIPLLRRASTVTVAVFDAKGSEEEHGQEPGADIALYLARHGINVEVESSPAPIDTGNAILSLAANMDADLLVMGAYGHSRFREMMLGGATRTVLSSMTLPVLMAH
ncbi:universal stress protein [Pseudoduganella sp. RAF53_2]|uniref:universal stress protein n=1 Tax=unclassified Pseudoduganella TaxID=2637179 RepID=UPI003F973D7C